MTALSIAMETSRSNPIDLIEQLVTDNDWPFERSGDDDLSICVSGSWCDYNLSVAMSPAREGMTLSAAFDFRAPRGRRPELCQLLAQVNERLWIGHFDLATEEGMILYRQGLPLGGSAGATPEQCGQMLQAALDACERYYPAFQFVLWGGKSADEAIAAAILDCAGEA